QPSEPVRREFDVERPRPGCADPFRVQLPGGVNGQRERFAFARPRVERLLPLAFQNQADVTLLVAVLGNCVARGELIFGEREAGDLAGQPSRAVENPGGQFRCHGIPPWTRHSPVSSTAGPTAPTSTRPALARGTPTSRPPRRPNGPPGPRRSNGPGRP